LRGEQAAGRQGELGSASTSQIVTLQVRGVVAPGVPLIEADNPNPPDVANAPKGPYIKDRMSSTYRWIIGLGNDELGYIIPAYNFQLGAPQPWIDEAEGDHYEETNSLGPDMARLIDENADLLMHWLKPE